MTAKLRLTAGGTALVAGVWFLAAAAAAPPALSKDTAKAAATADAAALQKLLDEIAEAPDKKKGAVRAAKALVLTIGSYGDPAAQGQSAKVLLALDKKDYKGAIDAAKGLSSPKADPDAVKGLEGKYDLEDVMQVFKPSRVGGLNIEKDIRDAIKAGKVEGSAAELIGARSAALADHTAKLPNDKAKTSPATTAKWERWAKDMGTAGKDLADEGAKGAKADGKKLVATLKKLDASCTNCHNDYRE